MVLHVETHLSIVCRCFDYYCRSYAPFLFLERYHGASTCQLGETFFRKSENILSKNVSMLQMIGLLEKVKRLKIVVMVKVFFSLKNIFETFFPVFDKLLCCGNLYL